MSDLKHYEQIFRQAAVGIARVAPDGNWLEVNDRLCEIVGYPREELLKLSFQDITHPDDLQQDLKYVQQMLDHQLSSYYMEKRYLHKTGRTVWIRLSVSLILKESGDPDFFISIIEDITELHHARTQIAEQKRFLQKILDTVPARIFWKDRELNYLGCNAAFAKDSGHELPEELIGRDDTEMGWADQAERYQSDDRRVMEKGEPILSIEEPQTTPKGDTIWLRTSKVPLTNDEGVTYGILGIYDDITARREAELELSEKASYQRALLDNFPFLVWLKDTQGRYRAVNEHFVRSLGHASEQELLGKNDFDVWPKQQAELFQLDDQHVSETGESLHDIKEIASPEGRRWYEFYRAPVKDGDGQLLGSVGFARDITEQQDLQRELERKEALLREAQSIAHLGNWQLNAETMRATWSPEVDRILGVACNGPTGLETLDEIIHPQDRDMVIASLTNAVREGTPHHTQYRIIRPDGEVRWVECQAVQKYDEDRKLQMLQGVIQDITEQKRYEIQLKKSESYYQSLFEQMPSAVAVYKVIDGGTDFVFEDFNTSAEKLEGISRSELLGKKVTDVFPGVRDSGLLEVFRRVWQSGERQHFPEAFYQDERDPGSWRESWIYRLTDDIVVSVYRDITQRKAIESQLRTLSQAVEQSPVSVIITDPKGRIEYVNHTFESLTGYSLSDVLGKSPSLLKSGDTSRSMYQGLWQALSHGEAWEGEFKNRKKNGELFWEYAHIAPVLNDEGVTEHYFAVKEDITVRKQYEEQILHQAHFDALTDLPNRFLSMDRLSLLVNEAQRLGRMVGVLFVDLDDFKKVNDSLGHEIGDHLLVEVSRRLQRSIRFGDTVGRLSGDEFLVILSGLTKPEHARLIADKLLEQLRKIFVIDGRELFISASVGITIYPNDGSSASELLRHADAAMYHSKQLGKNTYSYFTESMNREVSRRLVLEERMHGALEREEFYVVYQPQISVVTGEIVGAEALLRWDNPRLGPVTPSEFIPVAEQSGMIVEIGEFVLRESLDMARQWQARFLPDFRIAVNISPRQFLKPDLFQDIEALIQESGIPPNLIDLEITEGVLMSGHAYIDQTLAQVIALGVNIGMDDFGTGYSSLSYLRNYPFHFLKIDRSFVDDISDDPADRELINATISMAHGLKLQVVAEGVETREQFDYLRAHGCDYAQGFYFSKPLPASDLTRLLNKRESGIPS
ncbi:MAG: PAS domain S-box protein [Candidatus Thiodiazotropha sp.]